MGTQLTLPKRGGTTPHFRPISIVAKRLDASRRHFVWRWASARRHCARWGLSSPQKKGTPPIFGPCLLWLNGWMHHITTWYRGWPHPRRHCVRWGPSSPSPKGAQPPQISAHVRRTKVRLGMEVGLNPGSFCYMGTQLPPKGHSPHPIFGPCLLWPNGWRMDQDSTWHGGGPRPRRHCVRRGPSSQLSPKERGTPPNFPPMCIVAKRLYVSGYHLVRR